MNRVSTTPVEIVVTGGESSKRIDVFLANRDPTFSRSALQRLIGEGRILINGQTIRPSQKIKPGDRIRLEVPRPEPLDLKPEAIPFDILHEDAELLVLHKPAGLVYTPRLGIGQGRW